MLPAVVLEAVPRRIVWRMAGIGAGTRDIEIYGRLPRPETWEIERLLDRCGLEGAVVALAAELIGRSGADQLLPGTAGLSLAALDGRIVAAGLFVPAGLLLGGDAAVSATLRVVARQHGWDTAIYEALLGAGAADGRGRHGMIGFGVLADGQPWVQVGLRP